jgi:divalent metal cation (Fe/Co/Zn/Cd) transporter
MMVAGLAVGCLIGHITYYGKHFMEILVSIITAVIFSVGLFVSGMSKPSKIEHFLKLDHEWDCSMIFVMMSAVLINLLTFNFITRVLKKTIFDEELCLPTNN